jgi:hypothetical protein
MTGASLQSHDEGDAVLGDAVNPLVPPHWQEQMKKAPIGKQRVMQRWVQQGGQSPGGGGGACRHR